MRRAGWWSLLLAVPVLAVAIFAATREPTRTFRTVQFAGGRENLAAGALLVAKPALSDPNFVRTVVVLVQYSEEKGAFGLVVNRRTAATLAKVLPDLKSGSTHLVYEGGPVQTDLMLALFRSRTKPEEGQLVTGDVYETANSEAIEKIAGASAPERFHSYVGYCGWGEGQLENEVQLGAWSVLTPDARLLFDDDPDSLWQRLDRRSQMRIAQILRHELHFLK
ncbi:MAG: YqgE/AlgH family protein [Bryobacteraceae bacterium]|jgi:putative transcriptional regulator